MTRFERMYLDSQKKQKPTTDDQGEADRGLEALSEFEKNLEGRKHLMLKEINYDVKKLAETEDKLRAVSEIMTVFSQKVVEQGTVTEQSSQS